jgi:hypothetical protein
MSNKRLLNLFGLKWNPFLPNSVFSASLPIPSKSAVVWCYRQLTALGFYLTIKRFQVFVIIPGQP